MATPQETSSADTIRENLMAAEPVRRPGLLRYSIYYFRHKPLGTVGLLIVVTMITTAFLADLIAPYTYQQQNYDFVRTAPNFQFLFGTDQFGRDIFSRVVHGARISMLVGFLAVLSGTGAGAIVGLISGYFMGKLDAVVQRVVDAWMSFPDLILAPDRGGGLGQHHPQRNSGYCGHHYAPGRAGHPLGHHCHSGDGLYLAARSIGASDMRTMLRHIMPNTVAPFLIIMSSMFGTAILTEAGLSFLGLGISEPTPSWGRMLTGDSAQYLSSSPWILVFPGFFITITVMGFAFFGDALRDLFDPRLRGR